MNRTVIKAGETAPPSSTGGNGAADAGKVPAYDAGGTLCSTGGIRLTDTSLDYTSLLASGTVNAARTWTLPDADGMLATREWAATQFSGSGAYPGSSGIINAQTGTSYTLQSTDNGRVVVLTNAAAITLTIPSGLPAGFTCQIVQGGAGMVTLSASGTTLNSFGALLSTAGQYAAASILSPVSNTFVIAGNLQ
jgi:hypothetical protein